MTVRRAGEVIRSPNDWYRLAPPKRPYHWVPGRSAQELARAWLDSDNVPLEVAAVFSAHPAFGSTLQWTAEP